MPEQKRCDWARAPEELEYHDKEWGVPCLDDTRQFEFLVLESAQAGLSWLTILRRREGYRACFAGFDPVKVASFTPADVETLMQDSRIIRNRKKIESAVSNAGHFLKIQEERGSFRDYIWDFVGGRAVQNKFRKSADLPAHTPVAEKLAKDLKARGFRFLGPTVIYAHMQATGLVNDHLVDCFRYHEVRRMAGELGV